MLERPVRARIDPSGRQVVEVRVHAGYWPGAIVARAGLPLRIVFRREDDDVCTERVIFSAPKLDRSLAPTGTTMIDLPAQPPGEIRFTCGMGRYWGHIALVEEHTPAVIARLLDRARPLDAPLETALVLWICSLPLIALPALLALDATAALIVAGAALVAWVAGCVWASRRSTEPT
jgi:plastocyanin domain-containing protein